MLQSFEFVRIMQRKDLRNNSTGDTPWNLKKTKISLLTNILIMIGFKVTDNLFGVEFCKIGRNRSGDAEIAYVFEFVFHL